MQADVGVRDGLVVSLGSAREGAHGTVDASGPAFMPGIVDVHAHYDAQVTWDPALSPSVAMRERVLRNLSVVEGMDVEALLAGTRWDFETFPVLAQHSTIRTAVMGERASTNTLPTASEMTRMRQLVAEAIDAGAVGLASSFSPNHSGWGGRPMPSTIAADAELESLVEVLGEKPRDFRDGHRVAGDAGVHGIARRPNRPAGVHRHRARDVQPRRSSDGVPLTVLAEKAGQDPLDYVFDLPLDAQLVAKLFQNADAGVAPLLKHPAGVIALSDAGAHMSHFCDAGFGLHFLAHRVRETGTFPPEEAVRRLTSDPAAQVPHAGARPDRAGLFRRSAALRPRAGRRFALE